MPLPVDPAQIDPEDYGEHQTTLEMPHDEAIEHVREVCTDVGFGVPVEFSPSQLLNAKVDADRDPYYVLGACNPEIADEVLDVTPKMGGLFPCNMVIWEEERGVQRVYHLSIMRIARLLGIAPDDEHWQEIVDETGAMVAETFERLEGA